MGVHEGGEVGVVVVGGHWHLVHIGQGGNAARFYVAVPGQVNHADVHGVLFQKGEIAFHVIYTFTGADGHPG